MKAQVLIAGCLAALVALTVVWFRSNFEKVPVKERVGPSGEARTRDFLAAERFAERMGLKAGEVRSLPGLDELPANGILLLPRGRQLFGEARMRNLIAWAGRGGHLIIEAERIELEDPLLDLLSARRVNKGFVASPAPLPPGMFDSIILKVAPGSGEKTLSVLFNQSVRLETGERRYRVQVLDRDATALVSFEHGKGVITLSSTLNFARNERIGLHDDAEFVWHLLTLTPARELQVFFRPERLSLWGFLQENAALALFAIGVLLALWLWSIGPRFGPVAPDAPPGRRRLLDHLRASGRYFWTRGLRLRLVVAARDAALRRIARAQPDFVSVANTERIARLAALANISKEEAASFLSAAGAMRGADFIKVTQHAQRVHSALEKGAKQK